VSVYNGDGDLNNVDRICVGTFLELYCQQELKQAVVANVKTKHFYFHHQSNCYCAFGWVSAWQNFFTSFLHAVKFDLCRSSFHLLGV